MYRFYLRRAFAGRSPDLLVMREGGRVVSGVGVNYRTLRLANGAKAPAALLTAGWTSPASRGRGFFSRLLASAVGVAADRGCSLALAFMRGDTASARVLRRLGAQMLPTTYLSAETEPSRLPIVNRIRVRSVTPASIESAAARDAAHGDARFDYPDLREWRLQFLERPHPVETLSIGDSTAIVERDGDTDRLQLLIGRPEERPEALGALARRARRGDRRFLAFALGEAPMERTGLPALTWKPGHFALLVTGHAKLAAALEVPERQGAPVPGELLSPSSPWHLGDWRIQPGDRM